MINVIALDFYLRLTKEFNKYTAVFTALLCIEFMMRSTSIVAWIPLLFLKVVRDGTLVSFLKSAVLVAAPTIFFIVCIDSYCYSLPRFNGDGNWDWVFNPWNFVRSNIIEKKSEDFGTDPW